MVSSAGEFSHTGFQVRLGAHALKTGDCVIGPSFLAAGIRKLLPAKLLRILVGVIHQTNDRCSSMVAGVVLQPGAGGVFADVGGPNRNYQGAGEHERSDDDCCLVDLHPADPTTTRLVTLLGWRADSAALEVC